MYVNLRSQKLELQFWASFHKSVIFACVCRHWRVFSPYYVYTCTLACYEHVENTVCMSAMAKYATLFF